MSRHQGKVRTEPDTKDEREWIQGTELTLQAHWAQSVSDSLHGRTSGFNLGVNSSTALDPGNEDLT